MAYICRLFIGNLVNRTQQQQQQADVQTNLLHLVTMSTMMISKNAPVKPAVHPSQ